MQKDSLVKQLFAILGSACVKFASKHIDEIDLSSLLLYSHSHGGKGLKRNWQLGQAYEESDEFRIVLTFEDNFLDISIRRS